MTLTKKDLQNAVEDERRQGSAGFSDTAGSKALQSKGYGIVVSEANRLGWTYDDLVIWVDSKFGRWFWDELYGCSDPIAAAKTVTLDWLSTAERDAYYGF